MNVTYDKPLYSVDIEGAIVPIMNKRLGILVQGSPQPSIIRDSNNSAAQILAQEDQ